MLPNFPKQFGFLLKPQDMIGKTISDIAVEKMPWGCTWSTCLLIHFSDGSRGFLVGNGADIIMGPEEKVYEGRFFTPEEYGLVKAWQKRDSEIRNAESLRNKQRQLEQLQKELADHA